MKRIFGLLGIVLTVLMLYAGWIKYRSLEHPEGELPLAIRWEGFYHDMNFRDIGSSINSCLGESFLKENVALRSAGWFSGWSCDKVGNPEVIYSLNYSPDRTERYFCQAEDGKNVGRYFNPQIQLSDLEFLENWSDTKTKTAACRFLTDMFVSILEDQKILIHCDAGRDRTGTFSALLIGLAAEADNRLDEKMLDAIECDYRKSKSLSSDKHGRMKDFLHRLQEREGVSKFIEQTCSVSPETVSLVANKMLH